MYECFNCGGNLKFDIARQQLYCEYCGTLADPYSVCKERDAEETVMPGGEEGEYEVTVFTCPQCGGEILSEDTTAATFCSFCGASTILDSRISRTRRPGYILPFTRTKEDCKAAYGKMMRRAFFAPKELKDETLIEKFRGIYMPYWVYTFEKKSGISFPGKKTRRRGDYLITDHYRLECQVEAKYSGMAYDASSAFSDSLSGAIAPFDLRQGKEFAPSFLSGFYADASDVEKYVYLQEAEDIVVRHAAGQLARDSVCRKYHAEAIGDGQRIRNALRPDERTSVLAMLPVWFLSYRNGDRVSYAVVNGQMGKAAADLPVDMKKYLAGSGILAVPLFLLLNLFLTITPGKILLIAALLAVLCILISNRQMNHILARESGEDDKGLASVRPVSGADAAGWQRRRRIRRTGSGTFLKVFGMILLMYGFVLVPSFLFRALGGAMGGGKTRGARMLMYAAVTLAVGYGSMRVFQRLMGSSGRESQGKKSFWGGHFKEKWRTLLKPLAGIVLAAVILLANPVSDWFYYIGAFACMGTVLWAILDIIRQHNMLTTRRLPQLNRRGGDENE
nr:hypothetical protein [uncultured Acetatifactor sp.]